MRISHRVEGLDGLVRGRPDMTWLHDALFAIVLAGASIGRLLVSPVFTDSRLPGWLDRHLDWNRAEDEARAKDAERSHEGPPRGKDASSDW